MIVGKIFGFLAMFGKVADWLRTRMQTKEVARAKQEGRNEKAIEVAGEQQKQLDIALDARAEFGNRLRVDPSRLRESDGFELKDDGAGDQASGGLSSPAAGPLVEEVAGPSDKPGEAV